MRVIAGEARGRELRAPRGQQTRPTSDLMRGVIFAMLTAMGIRPARVLDLYAGSGALGIEALSRGAGQADFVDRSGAACAVIRANLDRLGFADDRARVYCSSVARVLGRLNGSYDLVLVDPPYGDRSAIEILSGATAASLWRKDSIMVFEHSRRDAPPSEIGPLILMRTRSHGSSSVSFYSQPDPTADEESLDDESAIPGPV
jgi:16S rRNA (guanine966-N2)-methyltransferase